MLLYFSIHSLSLIQDIKEIPLNTWDSIQIYHIKLNANFLHSIGDGNFAKNDSGLFMHTGGWLFVHDNNSIEVNLLECIEKEQFQFDKLDTAPRTETESAAGRIATTLQDKTVKLLQRRR